MSPPSPSFQTRSRPREGRSLTARGHRGGRGRPGTCGGAPPPDCPSLDARCWGWGLIQMEVVWKHLLLLVGFPRWR